MASVTTHSSHSNPLYSSQMNDSLINHLFLPYDLPSSADADYLLQFNHQKEHEVLLELKAFFTLWVMKSPLLIFSTLRECVDKWLTVQNKQNCSTLLLQSVLEKLVPGDFLPFYFHAQNAAILIELDQYDPLLPPLVSAWQVSLPTETITSSLESYFSSFPSSTYRLSDLSQLTSRTHCELLVEFMNNTVEYSKSYKSSHAFNEIRDVPVSHYVCQWWITQFPDIQIENPTDQSVQFKKKHRDQIRWKDAEIPFRRSGLWMTIKVVLETILTKHLGKMGIIVYKLLITAFLTHVIHKRQTSILPRLSTDLLVHCLRKIVRRLNKIEVLISSKKSNDFNEWIQSIQDQIKSKIDLINPKDNWQERIKRNESNKEVIMFNLKQPEIYQHSCKQLRAYLEKQNSIQSLTQCSYKSKMLSSMLKLVERDKTFFLIEYLTKQANNDNDIALTRMEIWVEYHLDQWINQSHDPFSRFEQLLNFFESYQGAALTHYQGSEQSSDPVGYSRFILTCLTIIRCMHQKLCADAKFQRLKSHAIRIPHLLELFEYLVLPTRDDMIRTRDLFEFFYEFSHKPYPDILSDIKSTNSIGVYLASHSTAMIKTLEEIETQVQQEKANKVRELTNAKAKYNILVNHARTLKCECSLDIPYTKCDRCKLIGQANAITVSIYECPIPEERESALAVIFELQMPIEFRYYRDILWMFVNRPNPESENRTMFEWLSVVPHGNKLSRFYIGPSKRKVKLVSSQKSISQSHYSLPRSIGSTSLEEFIYANSLGVQISPTKQGTLEDECRILTPQLNDENYNALQFSMDSTRFVQNQVIAQLSKCSLRLKPAQFIEFGSFRSGHRLQWWNLLSTLESDTLSMDTESVAILLTHALLQYGPVTTDKNTLICSWCSESHEILLDDHFTQELIWRLDRLLTNCGSNWQNELVLVIITVCAVRIFSVCNSTQIDRVKTLIFKCRDTGEKWIQLIGESIRNASSFLLEKVDELRDKIVIIGIVCLLTFSTNRVHESHLLSSNEDLISLLKAVTTVHDNMLLNKKQKNTSSFVRNLMRVTERSLLSIHPTVHRVLHKTSYRSLNEFTATYWAPARNDPTQDGKWVKRNADTYDGWYDGQYQSSEISIDFLRGTFLVNGMTIGFLPEYITSDPLFVRVFNDHVFEVQAAEQPNTYITKYSYHGDRKVHYEFYFNSSEKCLIIHETYLGTHVRFQLIPPSCFQTELPDLLVSNYSHWKNNTTRIMEFRPISFRESNFLIDKDYILDMKSGHLTTGGGGNMQILVNQASSFFQDLFDRFFIRLDDKPYVYMLRDNASVITNRETTQTNTIIHIYLSRLGIAFKYNTEKETITSREYPDMYVDENQWFGTLTGLTAGLLLTPMMATDLTTRHYLCRKLLVPYGQINATTIIGKNHPTITIERTSLAEKFLHQCFVFILNDRLRILQPTDSPSGFLYLALLHAFTSHSLPDEYTGMTGMERAFQLLNSAGCCSDQPFDTLSLNILYQIATLSPKVNYYPESRTCMEEINWNSHGLSRSMQHFGYYLIAKKLFEVSEQWNFIHSKSDADEIRKLFQSKKYNEKLLAKLYWDYRDSYNPTARLSAEMEAEIQSTSSTKAYQSTWPTYSSKANYPILRLVDSLYSTGDVQLKDSNEIKCFPLTQWLTNEYELKNTWIGLFKFVEELNTGHRSYSNDDIERLELLLDFLHYISSECSIRSFYLQILESILRSPETSLRSIPYPSFKDYKAIQETSIQPLQLRFPNKLGRSKYHIPIQEIRECFEQNLPYENKRCPERGIDRYTINKQLQSWRSNGKLRSFLENIHSHINFLTLVPFNVKITIHPPRFTIESFEDHHQIRCKPSKPCLDQILLQNAQEKFLFPHSNYFIKLTTSMLTDNNQKKFPSQIFPSTDSQINPLSNIANHFQDQLTKSWDNFQGVKKCRKEQIYEFLDSTRQNSNQLWNELVDSIISTNQFLLNTGLMLRIVPSLLISIFQQIWLNEQESSSLLLTVDQCSLLGGIMVNWVVEQQIERALHCIHREKWEDFEKEISNVPHTNWTPSKHLPWLIIELEMNITIRAIQVDVARHMIQPTLPENDSNTRNIVMQMNMGEGKTSVILPMLAVSLCSPLSSLVRIIVLKSLFPTNYQSLRYKLGGLLNRRVLPFACRRDMNFNKTQVTEIFNRLKYALKHRHVILASPEDILSFDLLTIDKCRRNEFDVSSLMLSIQGWVKRFARDILDESDEILHVKYQLIYSVGGQQEIDGGMERWKMIQMVLNFVKKHSANMVQQYGKDIFYRTPTRQSNFPEVRLLSREPFTDLCQRIAYDWLNYKTYRREDQQLILSLILDTSTSVDSLIDRFPPSAIQQFLVLRGLLSSEVLFVALQRRYRVKFGINQNPRFKRLMAVPFRAKDVAAENTEFGHPDVAIILTQLAYYYNGLSDAQMLQCFDRLSQAEEEPDVIYADWILEEGENNVDSSIVNWKAVNIKDYQQRVQYLFPTLRQNMLVVNYFLNHFVFPREAKQFPHKLIASAWDLSSASRTHIITGFSGTNDTQLLLPIDIRQCDLATLQQTDAIVLNNLLQSKNENYQPLSSNTNYRQILQKMVGFKPMIQVILDVGALFVDGTNQQIAVEWLKLSNKDAIDYVVYFESDEIFVCDRQNQRQAFLTSPASERLERCVFYLDEIHTRGTDFKFPNGFQAAVTLGTGLTKDRLVQACMRMRQLGKHHWLSFWSSDEVHQQIQMMKKTSTQTNLMDILRWVYENTQHATWDGLHHWAAQSLSFQRKEIAFRNIKWNDPLDSFTNPMMEKLAQDCLENEIVNLKSMYGPEKSWKTISGIYRTRANIYSSNEIYRAVIKRLDDYGGSKKLLAQLLDEEQQRELEQELEEERQPIRPPPVKPCEPLLHEELLKKLCDIQGSELDFLRLPSVFCPLLNALRGTTFYQNCHSNCWQKNLWISTEFNRVIETHGESLDPFLRPPRWIVIYRNHYIIFVSSHEANHLMGILHSPHRKRSSMTTLRLLLPRTKRDQLILVNNPALVIPSSITSDLIATFYHVPIQSLVELFLFNGTLYFETEEEQTVYCQYIGVCPKPRTTIEEKAFQEGWIAMDGFVENPEYRRLLQMQWCRFQRNPLLFIRKLTETRNNMHPPLRSHVGSILMEAKKHTFQ